MNKEFISDEITFEFAFKEENNYFYSSTLQITPKAIIIVLKDMTREVYQKVNEWINNISHSKFGEQLITRKAFKKGKEITINLESSKLTGFKGNENYSTISLDKIEYFYYDKNISENKAEYYLNDSAEEIMKCYYGQVYKYIYQEYNDLERINCNNICIQNCTCTPSVIEIESSLYPLFKWTNFTSLEDVDEQNRLLCSCSSFYYYTTIDFHTAIIKLEKEHKVTIRHKVIKNNSEKSTHENKDLIYLTQFNSFDEFMQRINFNIAQKNKNVIHHTIYRYLQADYVDDATKYLILYSIIEMCQGTENKIKEKNVIINKWEDIQIVLEKAYCIFQEIQDKKIQDKIEKEWNIFNRKLKEDSLKKSIKKLFENKKLDWEKVNSIVRECCNNNNNNDIKIKSITDLRNNIVHGSSDLDFDFDNINSTMSFVVTILILDLLGIINVEFDHDFPELNILKHE